MESIKPLFERNKRKIPSNKLEYESNSLLLNKIEIEKGIENYIFESKNKCNKKISTCSLKFNKKLYNCNYPQKEEIFRCYNKNITPNSTNYKWNKKKIINSNSCPFLSSLSKTQDQFYNLKNNNKQKNGNYYPNISNNFIKDRNKIKYGKNNKIVKKKKFYKSVPFYSKRGIKTFYKSNSYRFLLDERIKIIKKPQTCTPNLKTRNKSAPKNTFELEFDYIYKKMFDRKLPLNDLKNYKSILFEESKADKINKHFCKKGKEENVFTNQQISNTFKNYDNKNNTSKNNVNKNSFDNQSQPNTLENNNFETIELNGVITKVMTKLPKTSIFNDSKNKKEDFHKIMKHPLSLEQFGYKYLRNLNKDYKIYKNPLDDKDLIQKIHHLIINPNTKIFRNGNLMQNSAGFYRKKIENVKQKDYKELSKRGYIRLKNSKVNKFKKDIENHFEHIEEIKEKVNLLMDKNIKIFKEHKEELDNE